MTKRSYGDGGIDQRGENNFRLRYRIGHQRYSVAFQGTLKEAKTKLRELLKSGDDGKHVDPTRMTLGEWIEHWLSIGAPGRRKDVRGRRSVERYEELLRGHVIPALRTNVCNKYTLPILTDYMRALKASWHPELNIRSTSYLVRVSARQYGRACYRSAQSSELRKSPPPAKAITVKCWIRTSLAVWCRASGAPRYIR